MKHINTFHWSAALSLCLSLLGGCADQDGEATPADEVTEQDLAVDVSSELTSFRTGDRVMIEVTFTNDTERPIRLLTWGEAAADLLEDDLFEVTVDGAPAKYIGPHYKRPSPQDADYTTLAPGDSLTRTADISDLYDLTRSGAYVIHYADAHATKRARLESSPVDVHVAGRPLPRRDLAPRTGALSYTKCTTTQQSDIVAALQASSVMANGAASYLNAAPSNTPRYAKWFGAFSDSGWNTAKSHFAAITDAIDTKPLQVDCGCKKTYYAYVYPDSPYKVYVCKAFWSAPVSGTDSRGGTLIHELSHFTVVAGTDDHAYGQSAASSLAASNPAQALDNADSHEYFAENTPALQ